MTQMVATEIEKLFSMLHDGSLTTAERQDGDLVLTIDCQYLAELIKPEWEYFLVRLKEPDVFAFEPWTDPGTPPVMITALDQIIAADLEILSAESTGDTAVITCHCWNGDGFKGGRLLICCQNVELYDQSGNLLSLETFGQHCRQYWERFEKM